MGGLSASAVALRAPRLRRAARPFALTSSLLLGALLTLLSGCQERLIYFPSTYPPGPLEPGLVPISYSTDQGAQVSYLRPPIGPLHRLWIFFPGNGGMTRGWNACLGGWRADDALLLIEYPGFGPCQGTPSPAAILDSTFRAIAVTADALTMSRRDLCRDCGVVGHSLGCATALQCADALPGCGHVALFSPFTSLADMARKQFGRPICWILSSDENYDNVARLMSLAARKKPPVVVIAHGAADTLIPPSMGKELAGIVPGTRFELVAGAGHLEVLQKFQEVVTAAGR